MHVLLDDDLGGLTLGRLRPWHRMLARGLAARLDGQLADGTRPEASALLAARTVRLTSMSYRRDLAASLRAILAAAGRPEAARRAQSAGARLARSGGPGEMRASSGTGPTLAPAAPQWPGATRQPRVAVCRERISRSAAELAELARRLAEPGPLPARGVAMVSRLLADGRGPLYRAGSRDDLLVIVERAARSLTV